MPFGDHEQPVTLRLRRIRAAVARRQWREMSPEERSERSECTREVITEYWRNLTPEQRRARNEKIGAESRARWQTVPPEQRSEYARQLVRGYWRSLTLEERQARSGKLQAARKRTDGQRCPVCREPDHGGAVCGVCQEVLQHVREYAARRPVTKESLGRLLERTL